MPDINDPLQGKKKPHKSFCGVENFSLEILRIKIPIKFRSQRKLTSLLLQQQLHLIHDVFVGRVVR